MARSTPEVDGNGDDDVAPTQVATQVSHAADTGGGEEAERMRCVVCACSMAAWSILEREMHLNECLDRATMPAEYDCPSCGKALSDYNEQRRMAHVNACLDRQAAGGTDAVARAQVPPADGTTRSINDALQAPAEAERHEDYTCKICRVCLPNASLLVRITHVKQCGRRHGVVAADLQASESSEIHGLFDSTTQGDAAQASLGEPPSVAADATNAFAVMMQSSASRSSTPGATENTIVRSTTSLVSNAFDVLMKSSRTQAVLSASTSVVSSIGGRFGFRGGNAAKRRKVSGGNGSNNSNGSASGAGRRFNCPAFKRIQGTQPSFIVDGFRYASKALSSVYFLTHFHSDHYIGLDKRFDCGIIYCNQVTANLVLQELRVDAKHVHALPMNTPVDIHDVQVTVLDANHCPGAAIILFRLKNGRTFLHTGDFRYDPKMLQYASLKPFVQSSLGTSAAASTGGLPVRLDAIYLDTTYADPKYVFPPQQVAIDHMLELMRKHGAPACDKVLFLFGSYSIGKERLFMEAAHTFDKKVCVSKAKLKMIQCYHWPDKVMARITVESSASNLHVVPMGDLKMEHLTALYNKHRLRFRSIVAFRPTGWTFSRRNASISTCTQDATGNVRIYGIPYSEHSSFAELCDCIRSLNPYEIIPTVNCYSEKQVKTQVDALRRVAFHSISALFQPTPSDTHSATVPNAATS